MRIQPRANQRLPVELILESIPQTGKRNRQKPAAFASFYKE